MDVDEPHEQPQPTQASEQDQLEALAPEQDSQNPPGDRSRSKLTFSGPSENSKKRHRIPGTSPHAKKGRPSVLKWKYEDDRILFHEMQRDELYPTGQRDWERVLEGFNKIQRQQGTPERQRSTVEQLYGRYCRLRNSKKPTGDPK